MGKSEKLDSDKIGMAPPTTDLPRVPDDLLKVVRVKAKQTDTRGYTYKMHRLECSACGECNVSV